MIEFIKKIFRTAGIQIKRYPDYDLARRMRIMQHLSIDTLLDVGANVGQYGKHIRQLGYDQKIVSFEPLQSAFEILQKVSSKYDKWVINNYALGNSTGKSLINVSENSVSSSLLNMMTQHLESSPTSKYVSQQEIEVKTLDSIFDTFCNSDSNVMLKIDTQGFEKNVIDGSESSLKSIKIIQLEMSLVPLYESEMLFIDMIKFLEIKGFILFSLEPGYADPVTSQLLQVDGIFVRK